MSFFAIPRDSATVLSNFETMQAHIRKDMRDHHGWYVFQGISFLAFGFFAAYLPGVAAISATVFMGLMLIGTGLLQFLASFKARMHWWSLLSAMLSLAIGSWLLAAPVAGSLILALTTALFLAAEGVIEILLALELRFMRNWRWMLAGGMMTLMMSAMLWLGFPELSLFYLGLIIAANFIFYGIALLMLASRVRS